MRRIRSKSIRGKHLYLIIIKIISIVAVVLIVAAALFSLSVYKTGSNLVSGSKWLTQSLLSNNYEATFNDCKVEVTGSAETITYKVTENGITNTVVTSDKCESYFISIDNVQWGTGNKWLEIPKYKLVNINNNTWVPQDMFRYVNVEKLMELKEPEAKDIMFIGMTGIRSFLGMKSSLVVKKDIIKLVGAEYMKNAAPIERADIKILDSWENSIRNIYSINITSSGLEVMTDAGPMNIKTINSDASGLSWEAMLKVIKTSCAHIDQLDESISLSIFGLYKNGNNIFESVKGALRNE